MMDRRRRKSGLAPDAPPPACAPGRDRTARLGAVCSTTAGAAGGGAGCAAGGGGGSLISGGRGADGSAWVSAACASGAPACSSETIFFGLGFGLDRPIVGMARRARLHVGIGGASGFGGDLLQLVNRGRFADFVPQPLVDTSWRSGHHLGLGNPLFANQMRILVQIDPLDRTEAAISTVVAVEGLDDLVTRLHRFTVRQYDAAPCDLGTGVRLEDAGAVDLRLACLGSGHRNPFGSKRGDSETDRQHEQQGTQAHGRTPRDSGGTDAVFK